ncbi:MAG: hypothetical protein ACJ71B_05675, partial [Nitrososphaera sp.]
IDLGSCRTKSSAIMDYSLVRVLSLYWLTTIYIRDVELTEPKEEGLNKSKPYCSNPNAAVN